MDLASVSSSIRIFFVLFIFSRTFEINKINTRFYFTE